MACTLCGRDKGMHGLYATKTMLRARLHSTQHYLFPTIKGDEEAARQERIFCQRYLIGYDRNPRMASAAVGLAWLLWSSAAAEPGVGRPLDFGSFLPALSRSAHFILVPYSHFPYCLLSFLALALVLGDL